MSSQAPQNDKIESTSVQSTDDLISNMLHSLTELQSKVDTHHNSVNEKCDEIMKRLNTLEKNLRKMEDVNASG